FGPGADRDRLAGHLAGGLAGPRPRSPDADLHDVALEDEVERPVDRDPEAAIDRRQPEEVVAPPEEPADEAAHLDPEHLADRLESADRDEHSELVVGERRLQPAVER